MKMGIIFSYLIAIVLSAICLSSRSDFQSEVDRISMKNILIAVFSVFVVSCSLQDTIVCDNARKNRIHTQLDNIIEYYSACHYRMPDDINEICGFMNNLIEYDPEGYSYVREWIDVISKNHCRMVSYTDSVFLYFPEQKAGCCVYGTPYYWLKYPEKYPMDRWDYNSNFQISAFDADGRYIFNLDYRGIEDSIYELERNFEGRMVMDYRFNSLFGKMNYVPLLAILSLNLEKGTEQATLNVPEKLYLMTTDDGTISPYDGDISVDSQKYYTRVIECVRQLVCTDKKIAEIKIPCHIKVCTLDISNQ